MTADQREILKAFACAITTRPLTPADEKTLSEVKGDNKSKANWLARVRMDEAEAMLAEFNVRVLR